jgi:hypothetical protein
MYRLRKQTTVMSIVMLLNKDPRNAARWVTKYAIMLVLAILMGLGWNIAAGHHEHDVDVQGTGQQGVAETPTVFERRTDDASRSIEYARERRGNGRSEVIESVRLQELR